MKKNAVLYLCMTILGIGIITGGYILNSARLKPQKEMVVKRETVSDSAFKEITLSEAQKKIGSGYNGILYFGYESCPYCQEVKPIVEKLEKKTNVPIFYVNLKDKKDEKAFSNADKKAIYPYLIDYMEEIDGEYKLYVPLVVSIKDGKVIKGHLSTVDGHDASIAKMTDEQYREVYKDIQTVFMSIL